MTALSACRGCPWDRRTLRVVHHHVDRYQASCNTEDLLVGTARPGLGLRKIPKRWQKKVLPSQFQANYRRRSG